MSSRLPPYHAPYFAVGFGLVQGIINVAVAIAFIWLIFKLGKLMDAYSAKLKAKTS
jgi:hypothetical protein